MRIMTLCLVALLAGCASTSNTQQSLQGAATTPLNDLNLVSVPIPEVLAEARKAPYTLVDPVSCNDLSAAVHALDAVLSPDLDAPPSKDPNLAEQGEKLALGAIQNAAEGLIPYRGWVRKLTGAERHSKQVTAAIVAGSARRAFLKGVIRGRGCPAPEATVAAPAA